MSNNDFDQCIDKLVETVSPSEVRLINDYMEQSGLDPRKSYIKIDRPCTHCSQWSYYNGTNYCSSSGIFSFVKYVTDISEVGRLL